MHEMQTVVTDARGVCLSVRQPVAQLCVAHLTEPLPVHFGLFFHESFVIRIV